MLVLLALLGPEPDGKELEFYEGLWMRLLLSALISGDRETAGSLWTGFSTTRS